MRLEEEIIRHRHRLDQRRRAPADAGEPLGEDLPRLRPSARPLVRSPPRKLKLALTSPSSRPIKAARRRVRFSNAAEIELPSYGTLDSSFTGVPFA
jgi:hypothetical protein